MQQNLFIPHSSLLNPGAYITHNAPQPPAAQLWCVMLAAAVVACRHLHQQTCFMSELVFSPNRRCLEWHHVRTLITRRPLEVLKACTPFSSLTPGNMLMYKIVAVFEPSAIILVQLPLLHFRCRSSLVLFVFLVWNGDMRTHSYITGAPQLIQMASKGPWTPHQLSVMKRSLNASPAVSHVALQISFVLRLGVCRPSVDDKNFTHRRWSTGLQPAAFRAERAWQIIL